MSEETIDNHCLMILMDYQDGKISKEDAEIQMSIHGDRLIFDMLMNGFKVNVPVDIKQWSGVIGSESL